MYSSARVRLEYTWRFGSLQSSFSHSRAETTKSVTSRPEIRSTRAPASMWASMELAESRMLCPCRSRVALNREQRFAQVHSIPTLIHQGSGPMHPIVSPTAPSHVRSATASAVLLPPMTWFTTGGGQKLVTVSLLVLLEHRGLFAAGCFMEYSSLR